MPTSDLMKTPKQSQELNPLDDKRVSLVSVIPLIIMSLQIYDEYACNIASELREERKKRRRTAPIPFNIHLLDETEEDEEWRVTSISLFLSSHCYSLVAPYCTKLVLYPVIKISTTQWFLACLTLPLLICFIFPRRFQFRQYLTHSQNDISILVWKGLLYCIMIIISNHVLIIQFYSFYYHSDVLTPEFILVPLLVPFRL